MQLGRCLMDLDRIDRRDFLKLAALGSSGLVFSGSSALQAFSGGIDPSSITRMVFDVSYKTQVYNLPGDAERVHIWMPLPPTDEAQEIQDLSIRCPLAYEIKTNQPFGNDQIHIETGRDPESFLLEARYRIVRKRIGAVATSLDADSAKKYLQLTQRVQVTEDIASMTRKVVGDSKHPMDVGKKIFGAIVNLLDYDKQIPGCGMGDTVWIMKHKKGKCDDYHALFMAMMISQGIPVRWEQGFPLPYSSQDSRASGKLSGDCSGAHCWASFFVPEVGWVPVDVSEADKHPDLSSFFFGNLTPNRFKISEGRSIILNPSQGAQPLSTFAFAYAEADGIPLIYQSNYENVVAFDIKKVET